MQQTLKSFIKEEKHSYALVKAQCRALGLGQMIDDSVGQFFPTRNREHMLWLVQYVSRKYGFIFMYERKHIIRGGRDEYMQYPYEAVLLTPGTPTRITAAGSDLNIMMVGLVFAGLGFLDPEVDGYEPLTPTE